MYEQLVNDRGEPTKLMNVILDREAKCWAATMLPWAKRCGCKRLGQLYKTHMQMQDCSKNEFTQVLLQVDRAQTVVNEFQEFEIHEFTKLKIDQWTSRMKMSDVMI